MAGEGVRAAQMDERVPMPTMVLERVRPTLVEVHLTPSPEAGRSHHYHCHCHQHQYQRQDLFTRTALPPFPLKSTSAPSLMSTSAPSLVPCRLAGWGKWPLPLLPSSLGTCPRDQYWGAMPVSR